MDFSKIRKEYKFESIDVSTVLADLIKTFEMQAQEHGFRVVYDAPKTTLPLVNLDRDAVTQALMNLLNNAAKYSIANRLA